MTTPSRGRIVWAEILDLQGHNKKRRPAVILTPTDQITPGGTFHAVAVSSQTDDAPQEVQVALPWHPSRHPRTGLTQRCAAVCTWIVPLTEADILEYAGVVPGRELIRIQQIVDSLAPPSAPPAPPHEVPVAIGCARSPPAADRVQWPVRG